MLRTILESIDISFIKQNIQKAIKENPKRIGHGDTGKTGFWILSDGTILPHSKGYKDAVKDGNAISVHSHSSAGGSDKGRFNTFTGGDLELLDWMQKYGAGDTLVVIHTNGYMDILQGGNWKKSDFKYDLEFVDEDERPYLRDLAKQRGATYKPLLKWR